MKKISPLLLGLALTVVSCVPTSKYQQVQSASKDRQDKIDAQKVQIDQLKKQIQQLKSDAKLIDAGKQKLAQDTAIAGIRNRTLQNRLAVLENDLRALAAQMGDVPEYRSLMNHLSQMQDELATSEDARISSEKVAEDRKKLLADANSALAESEAQLQQSAADLASKNQQIAAQNERLSSQQSMLDNSLREIERQAALLRKMEAELAAKDSAMANLRTKIANALSDFSSDELTVVHKDGMVYVSLEEKLLFESGKYDVNNKGVSAIRQIASVIKNVSEQMYIMVEGHTDNVPLRGTVIEDNWDLSAKRATSVLRILVAGGVDEGRVQANGRADTVPVASNATDEGRRKNRRTEIILAPKIDQILKSLN